MPKVTDEHRERRRQQILDAARECFIRKGFHQTSMADVFEGCGLSSGAVYGYFRSKDEIIAAIADEVLRQVQAIIDPAVTKDPTPAMDELMNSILKGVDGQGFDVKFAYLAPQVWAEASRNDALGDVVRVEYERVRAMLAGVVTRQQEAGLLSADVAADKVAKVIFGAVLGYIIQRLMMGDVDPDTYAEGLAGLLASTESPGSDRVG